ncbi:MAG TPA: hypothetical protein VHE83_02620 [Mycobacteriales bacterium]|nr:hypothetical protein [Mycobacteriales bacterium]
MTCLITMKVPGDTATFQKAMSNRADEVLAVADRAKQLGAIHHRFGVGDGYIHVVDEWETPEAFETFFSDAAMQKFVESIGARGEPEITISEAVRSVDQF